MQLAALATAADESSQSYKSMLWRLTRDGAVAEANIVTAGRGHQLQLVIDGQLVFGCHFDNGGGSEQLGALAATARAELEERGWTAVH